jgi:Mannosylglycerate hydrolase MGH1-like glycoside hydrolase domain
VRKGEEERRLGEALRRSVHWRRWGPYLSERQWGTIREDYSPHGTAWEYFPHDHARSRAYRWGEDGLAGICDNHARLCFAVALWNERDPILKERLFGVTGTDGNHGEDVKEYYFYLDSTPTHSYMKWLYKYPQAAFPYEALRAENARRDRRQPEYELLDTGIFDEDRYFDVTVEYAKASRDDILIRITVANRGPQTAPLRLLPTLWFRNTWSWDVGAPRPRARQDAAQAGWQTIEAEHPSLGRRWLSIEGAAELLFTENDTNKQRLWGVPSASVYVKDAFHDYVVDGRLDAVNPARAGTKAAAHYRLRLASGETTTVALRLSDVAPGQNPFGPAFDATFAARIREADEFYERFQRSTGSDDARRVMRQAFAGLLWSKQFYHLDVRRWLEGDPTEPTPPPARRQGRNHAWGHLYNEDVVSMPDKWEYPWYAAWDLAFHCLPLAMVDPEFAKAQLILFLREWYVHPNGQIPAYEWAFGDVNPPVHAWAVWRVYKIDRRVSGVADRPFLERAFHKLLLNFTWWVNRKDARGNNVFEGGFLGLDNIGVFDRSAPLPGGGHLEQSDGTSWMAMYCLNMLAIALELSAENPAYEDVASKFFEHFVYIARAMNDLGDGLTLWDEADGFYYDVLHMPGDARQLKVRSMVGLIPLFAVETLEPEIVDRLPGVSPTDAVVHRQPPRVPRPRHDHRRRRWRGAPPAVDRAAAPAAARARLHAGPRGVPVAPRHPRAVALAPRASLRPGDRRDGASRGLRAGRVDDWTVRRQLELAGPDLVPRELSAHRVAAEVPSLLRRRPEGRMSDWLQPPAQPVGCGDRALTRSHAAVPARPQWPPADLWRLRAVPAGSTLARSHPLQRVLPRRRGPGYRGQPPDRLDRPGRQADRAVRRVITLEERRLGAVRGGEPAPGVCDGNDCARAWIGKKREGGQHGDHRTRPRNPELVRQR